MKNKFKVGDQVITRKFPKGGDGPGFTGPMHELVGKQGTVVGCPDGNDKFYTVVHMEGGDDQWCWPESALELAAEEKPAADKLDENLKTLTEETERAAEIFQAQESMRKAAQLERFTLAAMQGLLANPKRLGGLNDIGGASVSAAKATIAELEKLREG